MSAHANGGDAREGTGQVQGDDESREGWRETAPNPTQERIDREGADASHVDASWEADRWGETATSAGEESPAS